MSNITNLTCEQLQALSDRGDQEIETLYFRSRTNPADPLSGAPRLSIFALLHPTTVDFSNEVWAFVYRSQIAWKVQKSQILLQRRINGCFQII